MKKNYYDALTRRELLLLALLFIIVIGVPALMIKIEGKNIKNGPPYVATGRGLSVECVDRHKFVLYSGGLGRGISQMLTLDEKGNLVPAMCPETPSP